MQIQKTISFPLDDDGFLRRECPSCEREFKWFPTGGDETIELYYCPYCGNAAPSRQWYTKEQARLINDTTKQVADEQISQFFGDLSRKFRHSKHIKIQTKTKPNHEVKPVPDEINDMARVDFLCHPYNPIKMDPGWSDMPYCIVCQARKTTP